MLQLARMIGAYVTDAHVHRRRTRPRRRRCPSQATCGRRSSARPSWGARWRLNDTETPVQDLLIATLVNPLLVLRADVLIVHYSSGAGRLKHKAMQLIVTALFLASCCAPLLPSVRHSVSRSFHVKTGLLTCCLRITLLKQRKAGITVCKHHKAPLPAPKECGL